MQSSSRSLIQIEATHALLEALTKLTEAVAPGTLSNDEAFEIAAVRFLTAKAMHMAARYSDRAGTA